MIPSRLAEKILLEIPNSNKISRICTNHKNYYTVDDIIVAIPTEGIDELHLMDILQSQLGMSWWLIDEVFGKNDIK